jgi:hypothetical protein
MKTLTYPKIVSQYFYNAVRTLAPIYIGQNEN